MGVTETRPAGRSTPAGPKITVSSPQLRRRQLTHFAICNVGPSLVAIAALIWIASFGLTAIDVALFLLMYFLTVLGVEVGLHRLFSHGAFKAAPWLRAVLAVLGMTAGQGPTSYWAANHRRHHAFTDRDGDPHSPRNGFWHAHILWVLKPQVTLTPRFAPDLITATDLRRLDRNYYAWVGLGFAAPAVVGGLIGQSLPAAISAFLIAGGLRLVVVQNGIFFINSGGHVLGRRRFATEDRSTNIGVLALPTLGGALHHNHHAFPTAITTAIFRGECDPGGMIIELFARMGVAWDLVGLDADLVKSRLAAGEVCPPLLAQHRQSQDKEVQDGIHH